MQRCQSAIWLLLGALVCVHAQDVSIVYNTVTFVELTNATILTSPVQSPGAYAKVYSGTSCTAVNMTVFPTNVTSGFCFVYKGVATVQGQAYMFTTQFDYKPAATAGPVYTQVLNVLNYMIAQPSTIGPVMQFSAVSVAFAGFNSLSASAPLYVLLANLPQYGQFYYDANPPQVLNSSDIQWPIQINSMTGGAPFIFAPFPQTATLDDPIQFQLTDSLFTLSEPSVLTIIVHASEAVGVVTLPQNSTCAGQIDSICLQVRVTKRIAILVNYSDAAYWPADRIISVNIFVVNPIGSYFTIGSKYQSLFLLHLDLDGNFNPAIESLGSFLFSTALLIRAPLNMIQATLADVSLSGSDDGLQYNLNFPVTFPPFLSQLGCSTCIQLDPDTGVCSLNPSQIQTQYLTLFSYSAPPGHSYKLDPTYLFYVIAAICICCCGIPACIICAIGINYLARLPDDINEKAVPWCRTCFCCCCCFDRDEYKEKIAKDKRRKFFRKEVARKKRVRQCGCCFCACGVCGCCSEKLGNGEASTFGTICACCDYLAHKRAGTVGPRLNRSCREACCMNCRKKGSGSSSKTTTTSSSQSDSRSQYRYNIVGRQKYLAEHGGRLQVGPDDDD